MPQNQNQRQSQWIAIRYPHATKNPLLLTCRAGLNDRRPAPVGELPKSEPAPPAPKLEPVTIPQLQIWLDNSGQLWAEGSGNNGMRRKWQPDSLAELKADLENQAERLRAAASSRHTVVFTTVAIDHGIRFASKNIRGRVPNSIWNKLRDEGYKEDDLEAMQASGELANCRWGFSTAARQTSVLVSDSNDRGAKPYKPGAPKRSTRFIPI